MNNKEMTNKREISMTLLFSIIAMGLNYLISFLLTPYITTHLGTEAYGFLTLAKTIANYGIIITSCLNTYASRFITIAYHEGDVDKARKYYSSIVLTNVFLLIVVALFDVVIVYNLDRFITIPISLAHDVKVLFFIDIINYMLLALGNVFNAYAYVRNILDRIYIVRIISYLSEGVILFILFKRFEAKLYFVGVALIASTLVLLVLNYCFSRRYAPYLVICPRLFSYKAVKDLVLSGIWNSINNIGNLLNSGLDLLVSNLLLSATAMGELSIVKTVSTVLTTIAQLLSSPFHPQILKYYSNKDMDSVVRLLIKQIKLSGYVVCVVLAGFITLGVEYFSLWTPNQDIKLLYGIAIVTVIGFVFEGIATPLFYSYTLTLKNRIPCIITILSGFLNVVGMYILITYAHVGLYGVVGTTTVLGLGTYIIFSPLYSSHCLNVRWNVFYPSMLRIIFAAIAISIVTKAIPISNIAINWFGFILAGILICVISLPIYILCVENKEELRIIIRKCEKLFR